MYTLYNPPVKNLQIADLQSLYTTAVAKLAEVEEKRIAKKNAIVQRQLAFENLKPIATRIINLLDILGLPEGTINQAKTLNRTIQGSSKKPKPEENPDNGQPASNNSISTSRQSYTQQAENFGILLQLLETIPAYNPNEDDLKLSSLIPYQESLVSATQPVNQTEAALKIQLTDRDRMLYAKDSGLYDIAQNVKKYVKTIYGATSPEFETVSAIKFTVVKS